MAYAAGVDVGSTQTKAIVIDERGVIVGRALIDTGANVVVAAEQAYAQALQDARRRRKRKSPTSSAPATGATASRSATRR